MSTKDMKLRDKLFSSKNDIKENFKFVGSDDLHIFCDDYMEYLDLSKTEREAVASAVELLREKGFAEYNCNYSYVAGDKFYWINKKKSLIAVVVGKNGLDKGMLITAAHIDSPRLDLKPMPLYEDSSMAFLKTHYYGGVKKYQWTAIPLAMHGVVILADGSEVTINIGEDEKDPVFCITDLLPHLSRKTQANKTMAEVISGEQLNIVIGSAPYLSEDKIEEPVKMNVLSILHDNYGLTEDDFISAEIEIVPAMKARYVGLDRSMIGSYGQDDRVCAYSGLRALCDLEKPEKTCMLVLADKEEIGSVGNTGMNSDILRNFITVLCRGFNCVPENVFMNSKCLSADVNAAFDPNFAEVYEKKNTAHLNQGPTFSKYTGSGGKSGSNDASAEYVGQIRLALDSEKLPWQIGELGKVDEGGGGTVAQYISRLGIDTIDIGVGILTMHSPYELSSCLDVYALYKVMNCFYRKL